MKIRRLLMARRRGVVAVVAAGLVATVAPLGVVATSVPEPEPEPAPTASPPPVAVETSVPESAPAVSSVREWNLHAINALIVPSDAPEPGAGQTPPVSLLHLAMVHGAIFDAVNAIDGGYQPYLPDVQPASPSASVDAAVATAAHDVLVGLVVDPPMPEAVVTRIDGLYEEALAAIPDGADKTDGIAAGAAAAAAMLAARADDGRYVPFSQPEGDQPGEWRPIPPDEINDPFAWVANVQPFTLDSSSQFRSAGPPALDSAEYTAEYNEVKDLGAADSTRDPEQQAIAEFFTVNPVEMYNRAFRTVAETEGLSVVDEARLFAMVNVTAADTVINCWDDKVYWHFWRPVTAIHEGDNDGNDDTVGDPAWEPMLPAPPYPDSASGYNCVTASTMGAADAFFEGAPVAISLVRIVPDAPEVTREYATFTDVIDDTIEARVLQGLHFRTADEQGAEIGTNVAEWVATNHFQPAGTVTTTTPTTS
jgi:hypothetical protein